MALTTTEKQNGVDAALAIFRNLGTLTWEQACNHIPTLLRRDYQIARVMWEKEEAKNSKKLIIQPRRPKPRATRDGISLRDKLLLATSKLGPTFTKSELVVKAWELYPTEFALQGFPHFPDSNRVASYLCGKKGLPELGLLKTVRPNTYELTKFGRFALEELHVQVSSRENEKRNGQRRVDFTR